MDKPDILAQLRAAADQLRAVDDNLLRAIAAIAAHGRVQIIPNDSLFGVEARPVIVLPVRMYDRLLEIVSKEAGDG